MQRRKFMAAGMGAFALGAGGLSLWEARAFVAEKASPDGSQRKRSFQGADLAFGTTVSVHLLHDNEAVARQAIADALDIAHRIDHLLSVHRDDSQVMQLNRNGSLRDPHPHLLAMLDAAVRLSRQTVGAFDITVQPLWLAAQQQHDRGEARKLVDWRALHVSPEHVYFKRPGMGITLNGIAQGYATDLAIAAISAHGITDMLVDIGEFATRGRPTNDRQWQVGIQDPRADQLLTGAVILDGRSLATSGDYETAFTADFSEHHIVDPLTGRSPRELASVSVIAPDATLADGLSTALMVMGTERGMRLVDQMPGVDALFIDKAGRRTQTERFPWLV